MEIKGIDRGEIRDTIIVRRIGRTMFGRNRFEVVRTIVDPASGETTTGNKRSKDNVKVGWTDRKGNYDKAAREVIDPGEQAKRARKYPGALLKRWSEKGKYKVVPAKKS